FLNLPTRMLVSAEEITLFFHFAVVLPTPTPAQAIEHFTVNFTITNLQYASELITPQSTKFNDTEKNLISLLNPIFGNSSIGPSYIRCENSILHQQVKVHLLRDSAAPPFDRVAVYREVSNKTNGITKLGPYTLDKDSLYVNGKLPVSLLQCTLTRLTAKGAGLHGIVMAVHHLSFFLSQLPSMFFIYCSFPFQGTMKQVQCQVSVFKNHGILKRYSGAETAKL
uniref:SEA domain-containing protein n=1 Tax=Pelusios castaneus TaxID=367368 RepID=A0A8C8RUY2_9SAUR